MGKNESEAIEVEEERIRWKPMLLAALIGAGLRWLYEIACLLVK